MTAFEKISQGLRTFASDIAQGFFEVTHNGSALLGLGVVFAALTLTLRPDLRLTTETHLMEWLQERQADAIGIVSDIGAIGRATAANPRELPKPQAALAYWISRKYRVAPEPVSALVAEAYALGARTQIDPPLILAVIGIESGFNPFAQSPVGAQGLMQVMTHVHSDKFDRFGGKLATFDPVSNLRVGVKVLQECIKRAGSVEAGLRFYVGAANFEEDGGYVEKVLAEYERLKQIAAGQTPVSAWPALTPAS
jgi:soluble lytic murein transglycosylase-like protein